MLDSVLIERTGLSMVVVLMGVSVGSLKHQESGQQKSASLQERRFSKPGEILCSEDFSLRTSASFRCPATVGFLRPRLAALGVIQERS